MTKTYAEMQSLKTFEERFSYLSLSGMVGEFTFGSHRELNQIFYRSPQWKEVRRKAILRDDGCDLAVPGMVITKHVYVHHINPITEDDILNHNPEIYSLNNLVCVSFATHNAIHYGDKNSLPALPIERKPNDTCPWRN